MQKTVILNPGREKSLLRRHPWVFSKAIARAEGDPQGGDIVKVVSAEGKFLCRGAYSPASQIRVRALSFAEDEQITPELIAQRVSASCKRREGLVSEGNDGVRLIASEGDFLPGLICDRYNDFLVISISSQAMEAFRHAVIAELEKLFPDCSVYERSDTKAREKEGLEKRCGVIKGDEPPDTLYVKEGALIRIPVDIKNGHKTGAYLDQRASRIYASTLSNDARVLNCFCYTGGFGLWALKGGAQSVDNVDLSRQALDEAKAGVAENHLDPGRCRFIRADVFKFLREQAEKGEQYDLVILDPPKFAESQASLKRACRGYQDINRLGFELTKAGGHLLTFSCSGLVGPELFQKIVADAALDAHVSGIVRTALRQDRDHTVSLPCPETFYLKGLDVEVV
ncbi:MAG: class I SAM-dependent methyltransferase [Succinivibrio sp.]|jgi:23S rRNA (cytosine1962-C5)-methyltransferase|nr:class I SAM-dependent methyltransferase [Succinivibrio sp.]